MGIIGMHALIYSSTAAELRRLFGESLGWKSVDAGEGWLIFRAPPTELAVHPSAEDYHELYLMCDDIQTTVAELEARGARMARPVSDQGWGLVTWLQLPSGAHLGLYEPRHPLAIALPKGSKRVPKRGGPRRSR